jgi:hypothetical protein
VLYIRLYLLRTGCSCSEFLIQLLVFHKTVTPFVFKDLRIYPYFEHFKRFLIVNNNESTNVVIKHVLRSYEAADRDFTRCSMGTLHESDFTVR